MKALKIWYKSPRLIHKSVLHSVLDNAVERTTTTIVEDKLIDNNMKIPIMPYIHGGGLQDIIARGTKPTLTIANLLTMGLKQESQQNIVTVSLQELQERSGLSKPTVIGALDWLEDNSYLTRVGKQDYKVSARLAWKGNQVDWALELRRLALEEKADANSL